MLKPDDIMSSDNDPSNRSSTSSMYRSVVARTESSGWKVSATRNILEDDMVDESLTTVNNDDTTEDLIDLHDNEPESAYVAQPNDINNQEDTVNADDDDKSIGSSVRTVDTYNEDYQEPKYEVLYRDWEPKPEDCFQDVELADGSEISINFDAYEKMKRAEAAKEKRRARFFRFLGLGLIVAVFVVLIGVVIAVAQRGDNNKPKKEVNRQPMDGNLLIEGSAPLAPLEFVEIVNGGDMVTVLFEEALEAPAGSTIQHTVYDGPNCRSYNGGANDITGKSNYVIARLYSAHENNGSEKETTTPRVGFFLQWPTDGVKDSPLYVDWGSVAATKSSESRNKYATMDVCVGVGILDAAGKEVDYIETYIMMTWNHDILEHVRTVPLSRGLGSGQTRL